MTTWQTLLGTLGSCRTRAAITYRDTDTPVAPGTSPSIAAASLNVSAKCCIIKSYLTSGFQNCGRELENVLSSQDLYSTVHLPPTASSSDLLMPPLSTFSLSSCTRSPEYLGGGGLTHHTCGRSHYMASMKVSPPSLGPAPALRPDSRAIYGYTHGPVTGSGPGWTWSGFSAPV